MAELVDAPDLGSGVSRRAGSSPVRRTFKSKRLLFEFSTNSNQHVYRSNLRQAKDSLLYAYIFSSLVVKKNTLVILLCNSENPFCNIS